MPSLFLNFTRDSRTFPHLDPHHVAFQDLIGNTTIKFNREDNLSNSLQWPDNLVWKYLVITDRFGRRMTVWSQPIKRGLKERPPCPSICASAPEDVSGPRPCLESVPMVSQEIISHRIWTPLGIQSRGAYKGGAPVTCQFLPLSLSILIYSPRKSRIFKRSYSSIYLTLGIPTYY